MSPARVMNGPDPIAPLPLLADDRIGAEARAAHDDHLALRLWLRLLACSTDIENEIRRRLRAQFGITLARFDYLAQLYRHPQGLRMNVLSKYLMVTGGNITGLTDELEKDGFVRRDSDPGDRRSWRVSMTTEGRRAFENIAHVHEGWVVELLGGIDEASRHQLHDLLGRLRLGLHHTDDHDAAPAAAR